jgi:16S rRNA (guanine527-N7)-methyltransferase
MTRAGQTVPRAVDPDPWADSDPRIQHGLERYLDLLQRWGQVYNLTAIRDRDAMRMQHLRDSWALLPWLDRRTLPEGRPVLLDVGSGAGLPGVVVAIARPDWRVVCVDKVGKKTSFVRQVALELGLGNLAAIHARVEELPTLPIWGELAPRGAAVVTSRAFASLLDFVRWTEPCLAVGGVWLAMKGQRPDAELAALVSAGLSGERSPAMGLSTAPKGAKGFGFRLGPPRVDVLNVPGVVGERCLVTLARESEQPAQPVNAGST